MLAAAVVLGAADATPAAGVEANDAPGEGGGREAGWSTGMTLCAARLSKTSIANLPSLSSRFAVKKIGGGSSGGAAESASAP